ncbi:MAG TPA: CaiB/BaiF CoA-transferase family protein [Luteibaculaceae bacterium]|nr:CaiB/BaiF CoA-transferase family protein [Luteibaculaceae bacterium]
MFESIKVLELAGILAGPSVGSFFAELGAEVIKIENPTTGGDLTRGWRSPGDTGKLSAYYCSVNYKKTVIQANLKDPSDWQQVQEWVAKCDIVIANFKPADELRFQLGYEHCRRLNPNIIYASLRGFADEPNRPSFDIALQAECGFLHMNGYGDQPAKLPVALIDVIAGHQLKEALLIALLKKQRTGEGSFIETTLEGAALSALMNQGSQWLMNHQNPQALGMLHPTIAPYGEILTSSDGTKFVLAIGSDKQFEALCQVLNTPELARDGLFSTNADRVIHRQALQHRLSEASAGLHTADLEKQLKANGIPYGRIKTVAEACESPTARDMIREETIDGQLTRRLSGLAFKRFW